MAKIRLTQTIEAPPRHVAAFFVPQRMPYWYGAEMQSCFEMLDGASEFAAGRKVRISGSLAGRELSHTAVITRFTAAEVLEWRFHDAHGVRGLERWELAAAGADSAGEPRLTVVNFTGEYEMPGRFGRFLDRLITRRAVIRRSGDHLRRLAALVEHRQAPARAWSVVP